MTDQKYEDLMSGGWSYPKKESTDPEEVKKVVDKYLTDNKMDSETIDKKITDGVSKIVADAPEDFDTLKEMSDWISQHSDSAAAMNSDILDNKSSIESLQKDKANATDVETLSGEVENNTNDISEIEANITTNIYNLNDVVKGKWITDKNGSTGSSASWVYLPLNVKGLKTVTISALGGTASWNKHYFNDSNGTTIAYNSSQITASVPSDATILYVNIYEEFTDINAIKITTESVGEVVTDINASLSVLGKCKNLLKLKIGNMTQTGITLEVDNGKIHVYGTSTENTFIHLADITLKKGVSYKLCSQPFKNGNVYFLNGTIYQNNVYTPSKDEPQTVVLNIWNGQSVDFYITPMITTNINATYDDFVPYTGDGDTLIADVAKVKNSIQSGQNFSSTSSGTVTFPIPYKSIPNVVCTIIAPTSNTNSVIIKITNITEKKFDYITVKDNELNNDNTIQWISMGNL